MKLMNWFSTEPKSYNWKPKETHPPIYDKVWGVDENGKLATVMFHDGEWFVKMEPGILSTWGTLQKWRHKLEAEQ